MILRQAGGSRQRARQLAYFYPTSATLSRPHLKGDEPGVCTKRSAAADQPAAPLISSSSCPPRTAPAASLRTHHSAARYASLISSSPSSRRRRGRERRTSRVVLDRGELRALAQALRGVEESRLRGRDEADDEGPKRGDGGRERAGVSTQYGRDEAHRAFDFAAMYGCATERRAVGKLPRRSSTRY